MLSIKGLLVCILGTILASEIHCQSEDTDILKVLFERSAYVNQVFYQLVLANWKASSSSPNPQPIPEPMTFDNFTYNHEWILQEGESHTYNPLLFGYSNSVLNIHADNETYKANIHLVIPQAALTGSYGLRIDRSNPWGTIEVRHRGSGAYAHTFSNVEMWLNLTVGEGAGEGLGRPVATDVTISLVFDSCRLWAENFTTNGVPWDDAKWEERGPIFKEAFDEEWKSGRREILLAEGARSYLNLYFGFLEFTRDEALQRLIDLGTAINP